MNEVAVPLGLDYRHMSLRELDRRRDRVMDDINNEVQTLNHQFRDNPLNLDTDPIQALFNNLKNINESIENKKAELEANRNRRRCCGIQGVTTATWITIGIEFFAALLLGGAEIANFVLTQKVNNEISDLENTCNTTLPSTEMSAITGLGIARIVVIVVAAGLLVPLVGAVREINNDMDKAHMLMKISEIKEQGNEIRDFLSSFQKFKQDTRPDRIIPRETQQDSLSRCVRCLDHLPEKGFREHIPSKDHWISLMVQLLPEDHPIKVQLIEMRDAALRAAHINASAASSSHIAGSSSEDDEPTVEKTSPSPRRKFRGETMTSPLLSSSKLESPKRHFHSIRDSKFQRRWQALESSLGTRLDCIQLEDVALGRNGETAPDISYFGATFPVIINDAEGSSSDREQGVKISFSEV